MAEQKIKSRLREYILGGLTAEERQELERAYFEDDQLFESISATEYELALAFLRGGLAAAEHRRFRERLSSSAALRAKVGQIARGAGLRTPGAGWWDRIPDQRKARWTLALAGGAIVALIGVLAGAITERAELRRLEDENRSLRNEGVAHDMQTQELSFLLTPGLTREGGSGVRLRLRSSASMVRFLLESRTRRGELRAVLARAGENAAVWSGPVRRRDERFAEAAAPRIAMTDGDYVLTLQETSPDGRLLTVDRYFFSVSVQ